MNKLKILIDGDNSRQIVSEILSAADIQCDSINYVVIDGMHQLEKVLAPLSDWELENVVALVDSDSIKTPDKRIRFQQKKGFRGVTIYCAVPNIESWIFADDKLLLEEVQYYGNKRGEEIIERIPFPEEIAYPKYVAHNLFYRQAKKEGYSFLRKMDIQRACARTPSLKNFLNGIFEKLNMSKSKIEESYSRNMNRDIFVNLVREVVPAETIIYRSLEGINYTAKELEDEIKNGTNLGKQYTSDVLRLARDLLKRRAQRGE